MTTIKYAPAGDNAAPSGIENGLFPAAGRLVVTLPVVLVPTALFLYFFDPRILDVTRVEWLLSHDLGQHFIGWHAFRNSPWSWPLGWTHLLDTPHGLPIAVTDSNPLVSLILKPFSAVLPQRTQFVGIWYLLCLVGQYAICFLFLRRCGMSRSASMLGAIFPTAAPFLIREYPHDTLVTHWLITASFYVFCFEARARRRSVLLALLLATGTCIHPYFVVLAGVFAGLNVLRDTASAWRTHEGRGPSGRLGAAAGTALPQLALYGLATLGPFLILGYARVEGIGSSVGHYTMDPLAWFNAGGHSLFLPSWDVGPGQHAGYQYLGLGGIAALVASIWIVARARRKAPDLRQLKPRWLLFGCICLYLLALSPSPTAFGYKFGLTNFDLIPLAGPLIEKALGTFRASGRLFWTASHIALLLSIVVVACASRRHATPVLAALAIVQLVDLWPLSSHVRSATAASETRVFSAIADPAPWREMIGASRRITILPATTATRYESLMATRFGYELTLLGIEAGVGINLMYTAQGIRTSRQADRLERETAAFEAGQFVDDDLYVLKRRYADEILCTDSAMPDGFYMLDKAVIRLPAGAAVPATAETLDCGTLLDRPYER